MINLILAVFLWLVVAALSVGNSVFADQFIALEFGDYEAHAYKIVVSIVLFFIISWIYARQTRGSTWGSTAVGTGFLWVGLTIIFDVAIKRYVLCPSTTKGAANYQVMQDKMSECLMSDYFIWEGRLFLLLLACAFIAPLLMGERFNR